MRTPRSCSSTTCSAGRSPTSDCLLTTTPRRLGRRSTCLTCEDNTPFFSPVCISNQNVGGLSFGGDVLPADIILAGPEHWGPLDLPGFFQKNSKEARTPEIFECAKVLRDKCKRLGAIGYCFGGWGVFRLGAKEHKGLVDAISTAHPSYLTEEEISAVAVPVQICSPEHDWLYTEELKAFSNKIIPTLGIPYDYQFFPRLNHGFAVKGDPKEPEEREGMARAKNAAVIWFRQWLHAN